jgi:ribosomal protein L11 methyltransferase
MATPKAQATRQHVWRKLSAARWEDVWWDRLSEVADRLAITALAGAKTIRLEAFQLTRSQAERLRKTFGGSVSVQKSQRAVSDVARAPIRVRGKLLVVGSERGRAEMVKENAHRKILLIPAGMAFGTGDHATTSSCLRFLADVADEYAARPWDMLDLGCGSGILALAARMLGARRVDAGDFDPDAVRVARENARINHVGGVMVKKLDLRTWQPPRKWDVVAANLFSGLLVDSAPKIAAAVARKGRLVFSGVLRAQEREVVAALRGAGFRIERIVRKGKWVTGGATRS